MARQILTPTADPTPAEAIALDDPRVTIELKRRIAEKMAPYRYAPIVSGAFRSPISRRPYRSG